MIEAGCACGLRPAHVGPAQLAPWRQAGNLPLRLRIDDGRVNQAGGVDLRLGQTGRLFATLAHEHAAIELTRNAVLDETVLHSIEPVARRDPRRVENLRLRRREASFLFLQRLGNATR